MVDGDNEIGLLCVDFNRFDVSNLLDVADTVLNVPAKLLDDAVPGVDTP